MNKNVFFKLLITFFISAFFYEVSQSCELVMGYQKKAKPPLINKAPDNTGIYLDIYSQAAAEINCAFKVVRLPKKRVLNGMKSGEVDFYPGMKFTEERAIYAHFMANGLTTGRVGLSLAGMPSITHKKQLAGYTVLLSLGGINYVEGIKGVRTHEVLNLDIEKAAYMLTLERGDFFATDPFVVEQFLLGDEKSLYQKHHDCCGGIKPMYIGFSKNSSHAQEKVNSNFNPKKATQIGNLPMLLRDDSVAYQFAKTVRAIVGHYQYPQGN